MPDEPTDEQKLFAQLEQDFFDSDAFESVYGIKHECRCGDDINEGNIEEVPACYMRMHDAAMYGLARSRSCLEVIAESTTDDADVLRQFAGEVL